MFLLFLKLMPVKAAEKYIFTGCGLCDINLSIETA